MSEDPVSIDKMRKSYTLAGLDVGNVLPDPMDQFQTWFDEANQAALPDWMEPNVMTLSTCGEDGHVTSRVILLKGLEEGRFVFFTNYESSKGRQLEQNNQLALCFFWPHVERQVRIEGTATKVSRERSLEYFHSRPRNSQLGAWTSQQSDVVPDRGHLETQFEKLQQQYSDQPVPLPDHWGGYAVLPSKIEFWQGRPSRLHDRICYLKEGNRWVIRRLAP